MQLVLMRRVLGIEIEGRSSKGSKMGTWQDFWEGKRLKEFISQWGTGRGESNSSTLQVLTLGADEGAVIGGLVW